MDRVQKALILALPMIIAAAQGYLLWQDYADHHDEVYYIWMICDTVLNVVGPLLYLVQLERIEVETVESGDTYQDCKMAEAIEQEVEGPKGRTELSIGQDFYSMAYISMIAHFRHKYTITQETKSIFMTNVI